MLRKNPELMVGIVVGLALLAALIVSWSIYGLPFPQGSSPAEWPRPTLLERIRRLFGL